MSYDIYYHRRRETAMGEEPRCDDDGYALPFTYESLELNITSNLSSMFSWAYDCEYWVDKLEGQTGEFVIAETRKAVQRMEDYPEKAKEFNAPNGWGTYPNALRFLRELRDDSLRYKQYYLEISR